MKRGDDEYIAVGVGAGLLETNDILTRIADVLKERNGLLEERNRLLSDWIEFQKDMTPLEFVPKGEV